MARLLGNAALFILSNLFFLRENHAKNLLLFSLRQLRLVPCLPTTIFCFQSFSFNGGVSFKSCCFGLLSIRVSLLLHLLKLNSMLFLPALSGRLSPHFYQSLDVIPLFGGMAGIRYGIMNQCPFFSTFPIIFASVMIITVVHFTA